jgi:hypothetical protein
MKTPSHHNKFISAYTEPYTLIDATLCGYLQALLCLLHHVVVMEQNCEETRLSAIARRVKGVKKKCWLVNLSIHSISTCKVNKYQQHGLSIFITTACSGHRRARRPLDTDPITGSKCGGSHFHRHSSTATEPYVDFSTSRHGHPSQNQSIPNPLSVLDGSSACNPFAS